MKKITTLILISMAFHICLWSAPVSNIPVTVTQPDGTVIDCFATGDEYYNWLHDEDGYTIIQNPETGYYCYAVLDGEDLTASGYVVGEPLPKSANIRPYTNISGEKINEILRTTSSNDIIDANSSQQYFATMGTVNNIVVYIRFADQTEFPEEQNFYTEMFNDITPAANSMRGYFQEATYNKLNIISHFYPQNSGTLILSYQDSHTRDYYCKYDSVTNPHGYTNDRISREHTLLYNAIDYIKYQVPSSLNIDYNNDDRVDNVCFIVRGTMEGWSHLLWPHRLSLSTKDISINEKRVSSYNLVLETGCRVSTLSHEMCHTFGLPDLYHYRDNMSPVGAWDLMANTTAPRHMCAYMKYKYGGWITSIPVITISGTYTLQPLAVPPASTPYPNCYKIPVASSSQYLVVEYRKQKGTFEENLPGSGLVIYRINELIHGNAGGLGPGGVSDEIYVFRVNGTISSNGNSSSASFSEESGRIVFSNHSNPYCFTVPNGDLGNLYIKNIRENQNGTLSFDVRFCDNDSITYSNTSYLPALTNASNSIKTLNTVVVKSIDNVTFEAGDEVILNSGFEVQLGGTFEINMNECGEK